MKYEERLYSTKIDKKEGIYKEKGQSIKMYL